MKQRQSAIIACIATVVGIIACIAINGLLAYAWSFTLTTFGGYLGLAMPTLLTTCAACLGYCFCVAMGDAMQG